MSAEAFELILSRFMANYRRLQGLFQLMIPGFPDARDISLTTAQSDVLRSAIVFLHATLEDALRTLGRYRLINSDEETLEDIQKVLASNKKPFKLSTLSTHRGKTVERLLEEMVDEYLRTKSFGSTSEVAHFLKMLKLDKEKFEDLFPHIDELMKRRHLIVHTADLSNDGIDPPNFADREGLQLVAWMSAVGSFVGRLLRELLPKDSSRTEEIRKFIGAYDGVIKVFRNAENSKRL